MLVAPKENCDLLVGATQIKVSLLFVTLEMTDSIPKRNTEIKNPGHLQEASSEGWHSTA